MTADPLPPRPPLLSLEAAAYCDALEVRIRELVAAAHESSLPEPGNLYHLNDETPPDPPQPPSQQPPDDEWRCEGQAALFDDPGPEKGSQRPSLMDPE